MMKLLPILSFQKISSHVFSKFTIKQLEVPIYLLILECHMLNKTYYSKANVY